MSGLDNEKMKTKQNKNKKKEPKALKAFHEVKFKKNMWSIKFYSHNDKRGSQICNWSAELQVNDTQGNKLHISPLTACE